MSDVFITSDLHLGHNKDFIYRPRGFDNVEDMNEAIVERWNQVVKLNDIVYVLGDIAVGSHWEETLDKYFRNLNGHIIIAAGNHDSYKKLKAYYQYSFVDEIQIAYRIKWHKYNILMTHYPTVSYNYGESDLKIMPKFFCLCGHTHTKDASQDWYKYHSWHVELDAYDCYPRKLDDIISDIKDFVFQKNLI